MNGLFGDVEESTSPGPHAPERPAWAPYRPQKPDHCTHCTQLVHDMRSGVLSDAVTPSRARWRRTYHDEQLLLCGLHAQQQRERDAFAFPIR